MTASQAITRVLSVAGSDSGGGAGIQADLKAYARCGVHGMSAVTAVTAQNTLGIELIHPVPPAAIVAQIEAVIGDIGVDAVKVGMLGSLEAVVAVAASLGKLGLDVPIVVDPVLVASTGGRLLEAEALDAFLELLLPLASVVTPNLPEAMTLVGRSTAGRPESWAEGGEPDRDTALVLAVRRLGPRHVILTGGHRRVSSDLYWDGETAVEIPGERQPGGATHGSGCTHSAVLAAELGRGVPVLEAARAARRLSGEAIAWGLAGLGAGQGPVDVLGHVGPRISRGRDRLP